MRKMFNKQFVPSYRTVCKCSLFVLVFNNPLDLPVEASTLKNELNSTEWLLSQETIRGKVIDKDGSPMVGVTVQLKGSSFRTSTDEQGNFEIKTNSTQDVLMFSYIGYESQEIAIDDLPESHIIRLIQGQNYFEEVVVVGYGKQSRKTVTGAISSVNSEQITKQPVLSPAQALQGQAPGIQVVSSGEPGSQPRVQIRGLNTILTNENPLYVVDGVLTDDITNVNSADIVSIDILKDGAAAIYGSRAANGVILITTKQGMQGKLAINITSYAGFRQLMNQVKMADATFYAKYTDEAREYDQQPPIFNSGIFDADTDWYNEITRKGAIQNHAVNLSGGNENARYFFSAGYFQDQGVLRKGDFERISLRSNNEFVLTKFLKIGNVLNVNIANGQPMPTSAFNDAYRSAPTVPVRDASGGFGFLNELDVENPVAMLEYTRIYDKNQRFQGNLFAEAQLIEGLSFRSVWGFDKLYGDNQDYKPFYKYGTQSRSVSELYLKEKNKFYWVWDNILSYTKQIDKSVFDLTLGHSTEQDKGRETRIRATNVPEDRNLWYLSKGDPTISINPTDDIGYNVQRQSVFFRANYSYNNKYNISGVLRRDGSSAFPANQKWGTFYSISGSWLLSEEAFLKDISTIEYLKLRGGYTVLGNDGISRLVNNELAELLAITQTNPYGFPGGLLQGITFDQIKDAQASWETTKGIDAGIEFGLLNSRLSGEIGYYNKLTNAYIRVPTPPFVDPNGILSRAADVRNSGIELSLNWRNKVNENLNYHFGGNATFNKNNVDAVRGGIDLIEGSLGNGESVTKTVLDQPIGSFWVYQTDGIYQTQQEIDNSAHFDGSMPGDFRYKDINNDGTLDSRDRIFVGSYQPKFYYGFNAGITWKYIDFSIDTYGNYGNKVYNGKKGVRFGNENIEASRIDRWTLQNPTNLEPRASNSIPRPSTYFVESGSFFRINNITLGYTFPKTMFSKGIDRLRLFITAQNPLIIKEFSGFSPELPGTNAMNSGIELGVYPTISTYMFGLNINFK